MPVRVARFALGGRAEDGGDVVVALHVGLGGKVQVATIRLRFTGEGILEILFGLAPFERHSRAPFIL